MSSGHEEGVALIVLAVGSVAVAVVRSRWRWGLLGATLVGAALLLTARVETSCVLAGTLVETPAGPRAIETLRVGDAVVSVRDDGTLAVSTVAATRVAAASSFLEIEVEGGATLRVTASHPLRVGGGWREAGSIRVGDVVRGRDGAMRVVRVSRRDRLAAVCDLTVAPDANFLASGVLVHNKSYFHPWQHEPLQRYHILGTWIGWAGSGETTCMLTLGDDPPGRCVLRTGDDIRLFRVARWELGDHEVMIELEAGGAEGRLTLRGRATPRTIWFEGADDIPKGLSGIQVFPEWLASAGAEERLWYRDDR